MFQLYFILPVVCVEMNGVTVTEMKRVPSYPEYHYTQVEPIVEESCMVCTQILFCREIDVNRKLSCFNEILFCEQVLVYFHDIACVKHDAL